MQNLATILDAQQKYPQAEKYLREALRIERKELGEEHIETAVTMNNLGVLLAHLGTYEEAKRLLDKSVSLREAFYGPNHHLTICARQNLDFVVAKTTEGTPGTSGGVGGVFPSTAGKQTQSQTQQQQQHPTDSKAKEELLKAEQEISKTEGKEAEKIKPDSGPAPPLVADSQIVKEELEKRASATIETQQKLA
jgi:tetratricopeptide (TPR) repeat protein